MRVAELDVSRDRFANRGKTRRATVLRFRLSRDARMVLVVRGPGPGCATVGRIPFSGEAGPNRIRFTGRIARKPLRPGTYLLTLRERGRPAATKRALVTIDPPGPPRTARVAPDCSDATPAARSAAAVVGPPQRETPDGDAAARPAGARASDARAASVPSPAREAVRGEQSPIFDSVPPLRHFDERDELPRLLGLILLGLLVVSLVGFFAEVIRHVRSSHA